MTPQPPYREAPRWPADGPRPGPPRRPRGPRLAHPYLRYVAGRAAGAAVSLFAVLVTSFFLFRLVPATRSRP